MLALAATVLASASLAFAQVPQPLERPIGNKPATAPLPPPRSDDQPIRSLNNAAKASKELSKEAKQIQLEAGELRRQSIAAAAAVQEKEQAITLAEDNLDILSEREGTILERLNDERLRLTETLAALQMLERQRPPAIAVSPDDATKAVRSAILLSELVPRLRQEADGLSNQLTQLRHVRERILAERTALSEAAQTLKADQGKLDALMAEKAKRYAVLSAEVKAQNERIRELAKRSKNLSGFINDLGEGETALFDDESTESQAVPESSRPGAGLWASPGTTTRNFADARGAMKIPVIGKIIEKFGVPNKSGGRTKGIKIATRPGAPVVAPFDGRVRYAGPLKVFGQVLIVEAGEDYLIVLAGLGRVDAIVGQWLLAGEPVGQMAPKGAVGAQELYMEFRKAREPFDPLPWLAVTTQEG